MLFLYRTILVLWELGYMYEEGYYYDAQLVILRCLWRSSEQVLDFIGFCRSVCVETDWAVWSMSCLNSG